MVDWYDPSHGDRCRNITHRYIPGARLAFGFPLAAGFCHQARERSRMRRGDPIRPKMQSLRLFRHRSRAHLPSLQQTCLVKQRTRPTNCRGWFSRKKRYMHDLRLWGDAKCWRVQRSKRHRRSASSCSGSYRESHAIDAIRLSFLTANIRWNPPLRSIYNAFRCLRSALPSKVAPFPFDCVLAHDNFAVRVVQMKRHQWLLQWR